MISMICFSTVMVRMVAAIWPSAQRIRVSLQLRQIVTFVVTGISVWDSTFAAVAVIWMRRSN